MPATTNGQYEDWDVGAFSEAFIAFRGAMRQLRSMVEAGWSQERILDEFTRRELEDSRPMVVQFLSTYNQKLRASDTEPQYWDTHNPMDFADTEV
jgi:hypothetical protein